VMESRDNRDEMVYVVYLRYVKSRYGICTTYIEIDS
jgi:hypothetical protein